MLLSVYELFVGGAVKLKAKKIKNKTPVSDKLLKDLGAITKLV
ncbi:MAG: hypothetical protein Ta2C_07990 [Candidatus Endomicrobiellum trichonymphae]|nr:hypothetical protein [Candidatus Endomicrobium trichonymphae]GMO54570.1 MAG: hypothetical protein Ta2C_07990 [Candidatus Endomicrobium trichonymphae]